MLRRDTKSNKLEVHAPFDYNPNAQYHHEEAEPFTPHEEETAFEELPQVHDIEGAESQGRQQ